MMSFGSAVVLRKRMECQFISHASQTFLATYLFTEVRPQSISTLR